MFRSTVMPAALALALLVAPASAQDASSLTLEVPLFSTKDKKGVISYKPLKIKKGGATVTVRFYDGEPAGDAPIHTSEVFIAAKVPGAPFAPGNQPQDDKVSGRAFVTLSDLPTDLLTKNLFMTTQVTTEKKAFGESPARPLGLGGVTEGRDLNPRSVTLGEGGLVFGEGAAAGLVLTSDAQGVGSWKSLADIGLADGSVGSAQIADGGVTAADLADGSVGSAALAAGSVGMGNLAIGSVGPLQFITGAVGPDAVADDSLTADDLADGSVRSAEIADRSITFIDIAEGAVGQFELDAGAVTTAGLTNGAVTLDKLALGAVDSARVLDNSLIAADLAPNSVGASEIASNAVGSSEVTDNSLTASDLASGSVGADELQTDSVTSDELDEDDPTWGFNGTTFSNVNVHMGVTSGNTYGLYLTYDPASNHSYTIAGRNGGDHDFWITRSGDLLLDGTISQGDGYAQMLRFTEDGRGGCDEGDVLVVDPHNPRSVTRSSGARSTLVAGVYAAETGLRGSHREWDEPILEGEPDYQMPALDDDGGNVRTLDVRSAFERYSEVPVGMSGIVKCKVSAENGAILPGDLLVTAWTPGCAMRDGAPQVGTVLGKALGELTSGTGVIDIIVTLD